MFVERLGQPTLPLIKAALNAHARGCWLVLLGLLGCADTGDAEMGRAREEGIRAGFSIEPPYAFVDSAGVPTGEAPEVLRAVAAGLGIDLRWVPLEFGELIPALRAGEVDVIAAGMFITPERSQVVRFSRPTVCAGPYLVSGPGMDAEIRSLREARLCPHCALTVLRGSVEHTALVAAGFPAERLMVTPDLATALASIHREGAHGLVISAPTARLLASDDPGLEAMELSAAPGGIAQAATGCAAFAFRRQDAALAEEIDEQLREFIGSPRHMELVRPFGFRRSEIRCAERSSGDATATVGCAGA